MVLVETTTNDSAGTPPKLTPVTFTKLVPSIVTDPPCAALVGLKTTTVGGNKKVKPAIEAPPAGDLTLTAPVEPLATTAVIEVDETIVNEAAAVVPNNTSVVPVKFVPVIVTVAPVPAVVGLIDEMVGGKRKVNPGEVAVPPAATTETVPLDPAPTMAVRVVDEVALNEVAGVPPKLTSVTPMNPVPLIVTKFPPPADVGVKEEMVGAATA